MIFWPLDLSRSREKLKLLYLHYHSAYEYQVWLDGAIPSGTPIHKVIWRFDFLVLQGNVTNENHYISTTRVTIATKLGRMITYFDGLLPITSHDTLISLSCEITWQTKTIIFPIPQCLWPPNLVGCWLTLSGSL